MLLYLQMIDTEEEKTKFEQIYWKYRRLMFTVALQVLHNMEDAEDVVQSSFIKIAENIPKIGAVDSPKTMGYIVTIVKNRAIDVYRKKARQNTVELCEKVASDTEYSGDNELAKQILKLPEKYRSVILLKYYHGYTTREIAGILNITEANASKIDQRAKEKLQKSLEREDVL